MRAARGANQVGRNGESRYRLAQEESRELIWIFVFFLDTPRRPPPQRKRFVPGCRGDRGIPQRKKTSRLILPDRVPSLKLAGSLAIRTADNARRPGGAGGVSHPVARTHGGKNHARALTRRSQCTQAGRRRKGGLGDSRFDERTHSCHSGRRWSVAGIVDSTNEPIPAILAGGVVSQGDEKGIEVAYSRRRTSATRRERAIPRPWDITDQPLELTMT